ncbi:phosphatase PAP2 family protein [Candidatus Thiodictyon syntrophicum]|uniref:undecaprenyl-diphosphate phosphatase n=1 Tax=Candidatus Thiodictyon syntrophicum TaxID=1166950 RepID=A0A2K8U1X0_9GAMM|nr:phosphatase PAP2 family protein [Candidatus Thiodictyon syntrophicum]AUB79537.1 phosphoesterase PA-phosphatase [Candidatus Thiodictyon syntrophicum]
MTEGLIATWRRELGSDLRRALAIGAARTPLDPPGGGAWLAAWALACLTTGLTLWLAGGYHAGFAGLNAAADSYPGWVLQWLTAVGGDAAPFALGLFLARRYPRVLLALMLAAILASAYSRGLKPLFDAARPSAVMPLADFNLIGPALRRASFPSGHSVAAGALCGVLVYYARWSETRVLWVLLATLVGLSRVAVGVHWPVDVAFGLAGGVLAAWIGARLAARWGALASKPGVHLTLVAICALSAISLLPGGGDYPLARPLLQALGGAALAYALAGYVVMPLVRRRRAVPVGSAARAESDP